MSYDFQQNVGDVPESSTLRLGGTVQDDAGVAVAGSTLTTCTLSVYDTHTGTVVPGYDAIDIKSSVNGSGVLSHRVPMAALAVASAKKRYQRTILVRFTYNSGLDGGWFRWLVTVIPEPKVA